MKRSALLHSARTAIALAGMVVATGLIELLNGRSLLCRCNRVRLWAGAVRSPENSQQFADWYSLSHVVHGLLLYAAARLALPRRSIGARVFAAALIECIWETIENTSWIINRYRAETVSWGYTGDTVFNSAGDVLFMLVGFAAASRLTAVRSVTLGLALELVSLAAIRDNLTLNILMLIHPIGAVRIWQGS